MLNPKPIVELHPAIRMVDLRKTSAYKERHFITHNFILLGMRVNLVRDPIGHDWYLNFLERGPNSSNSAVTLVRTRCNYGGYREWFECPNCLKRAGVLYLHDDNFKCRKCLGLGYLSQRMNYQTLAPTIQRMIKLDKMHENKRRYFYAGNPTKWFERYQELSKKVGWGMDTLGTKYLKESREPLVDPETDTFQG